MNIFPSIKGHIADFDIIVIGHLRWNRYWGEGEANPPRGYPSTCTSTLIRGTDAAGQSYVLLVDPTWRATASDFYFDLNRRTGLHADDVTHCFCTHPHADHQIGLGYFPNATWCAAPGVAEELRGSEHIDGARVQPVEGEFLPGVATIHLPGHTPTLHGVAFIFGGRRYVVAGDGVMTKTHFAEETTEFEKDAALAAETIRNLKASADVVVPGHGNVILVG